MLSHGGIVAAPAANNQRQLFGKYQRCLIGSTDGLDSLFTQQAPPVSEMQCNRSIIVSSMQTRCFFMYCPCAICINISKVYQKKATKNEHLFDCKVNVFP